MGGKLVGLLPLDALHPRTQGGGGETVGSWGAVPGSACGSGPRQMRRRGMLNPAMVRQWFAS